MQPGPTRLWGALVRVCLGVAVIWTAPLQAQHDRFKAGTIRLLDERDTQALRDHLANDDPEDWDWVLRNYFGVIYDSSLATLVVYLPETGGARQSLIWKGTRRTWLPGQQNLWLMLFAEDASIAATGEGLNNLSISLTSLDYQKDRFLVALIKGLTASLLTRGVLEPQGPVDRETVAQLRVESLSTSEVEQPLYVATHRFTLAENTSNRISIRPASEPSFPADRSVHYNFGNSSGSSFGVSLAGGLTFCAASDEFSGTTVVERTADVRMSFYLFGHLHFRRPRLPWSGWSVGLAGGTNILGGSFLEDVVAGLSFGGIVGDIGVITGVNLLEYRKLENGVVVTSRKARLFLGVDFAL